MSQPISEPFSRSRTLHPFPLHWLVFEQVFQDVLWGIGASPYLRWSPVDTMFSFDYNSLCIRRTRRVSSCEYCISSPSFLFYVSFTLGDDSIMERRISRLFNFQYLGISYVTSDYLDAFLSGNMVQQRRKFQKVIHFSFNHWFSGDHMSCWIIEL